MIKNHAFFKEADMRKKNEDFKTEFDLQGMKSIASYCGYSIPTVLKWVSEIEFPASKLCGVWVSNRTAIKQWQNKISKW